MMMVNATSNHQNKTHQTTLRLTDEQFQQLKQMGAHSSMTAVISRAIQVEWEYHQSVPAVAKQAPQFQSREDAAKWITNKFQNSPELLNKFANAMAINEHTQALENDYKQRQLLINEMDTFNYLIRTIGNNINQLAHKANQGVAVSRDELAKFTKYVIKLDNAVQDLKGKV